MLKGVLTVGMYLIKYRIILKISCTVLKVWCAKSTVTVVPKFLVCRI